MIKRVAVAFCLTLSLLLSTGLLSEQLGLSTVLPPAPKVQASSHEPNRCSTKSDQIVKVERFELKNVSNGIEISFRLRSDVYLDGDRQYFRVKIYRINEDGWGAIAGNQGTFAEPYEAPITIGGFAQDMRERTASGKHVDKTVKLNETRDYLIWGDVTNYEMYPNCSASKSMKYQSGGTDVDKDTPPCVTNLRPVKKKKEDQVIGFHQVYLNWDFSWPNKPSDAVVEFRQNYIVPAMGLVPETPFTKNEGLVRLLNIRDETKFQILAFNKTKGNFRSDCKPITFFSTEAGGPYKWVDQGGTSHDVEAGEFANDASGGGGVDGVGESPPPVEEVAPDIGEKPFKGLGEYIADPDGFVYKSWRVTRAMINILLIIALMVISFSNITRISLDTYTIKKILPNLIIGVILANASFLIIRYFADVVTVITYFFVEQTGRVGQDAFGNFLADAVKIIGVESIETTVAISGFLAPLLMIIIGLIAVIGILWLAFVLYFRLVAIYLLTILSPLVFVSYGIPGLDKYFKQWWQQFIKWMFMVPAITAVLWLMIRIGQTTSGNNSVAKLLIIYVLFFTALTLPSKWGGAVIDKASKAFMKYTGAGAAKNAAMQGASDFASKTGQQLALRAPLYGRLKKSMEFAKKAQEQDIKNLQTSAESKAMRGKNYRKFARTTKRGEELSNYLGAEQAKANTRASEGKVANFLDRLQRRRGSLPERQISSAYEKGLEEAKEKVELNRRRVAFAKDDNNKQLMEQFAAASSKDKAFADAVQSAEREVTGIYTTGRKDVISKLREAGDVAGEIKKIEDKPEAARTDEEKNDLSFYQSYHSELLADLEKLKAGHDDLAGMSAEEMVKKYQEDKTFSTLVKAEEKRQAKAFNEGIKAQNEDTLADGSVKSILKDINDGLKDLNETERANLKKKFFNSDTIGMDAKFQNTLIKNIQALKDIGKNQRDTRSPEALRELASMIMKDGDKPIIVKNKKTGEEHTFDNFDDFQSKLFIGDQSKGLSQKDMQNAVLSHDSISGTPASHLGKTPKKDD